MYGNKFSLEIQLNYLTVVVVEVLVVVLVVVVLVEVVELSVIHIGSSLGVTGDAVVGNHSSGIVNGGKVGQFGSRMYKHILVPITMIDI